MATEVKVEVEVEIIIIIKKQVVVNLL